MSAAGIESKPKILIVDDEKANAAVLVEALRQDYSCSVATNGEDALKLAEQEPHPHLILLDVLMPGLGGFDVCKRLKANQATTGIPVIFVTSMGDAINEEQGFELGAVDYIHKPISPAIVRARVKLHLSFVLHTEFLKLVLDQRNRDLEAARSEAGRLLSLMQRQR